MVTTGTRSKRQTPNWLSMPFSMWWLPLTDQQPGSRPSVGFEPATRTPMNIDGRVFWAGTFRCSASSADIDIRAVLGCRTTCPVDAWLTTLAPQPPHKAAYGSHFPWLEGLDHIFCNGGATGSNPVSPPESPLYYSLLQMFSEEVE